MYHQNPGIAARVSAENGDNYLVHKVQCTSQPLAWSFACGLQRRALKSPAALQMLPLELPFCPTSNSPSPRSHIRQQWLVLHYCEMPFGGLESETVSMSNSATLMWPLWLAYQRAVLPQWSCRSLSIPASSSCRATSMCPFCAASIKAVLPYSPRMFLSTLASTNNCTISTWPFSAAHKRAALPARPYL